MVPDDTLEVLGFNISTVLPERASLSAVTSLESTLVNTPVIPRKNSLDDFEPGELGVLESLERRDVKEREINS